MIDWADGARLRQRAVLEVRTDSQRSALARGGEGRRVLDCRQRYIENTESRETHPRSVDGQHD
jgi:hypothetical protein